MRFMRTQITVVGFVSIVAGASAYAQQIYWTDFTAGTVSRAELDGSNDVVVISGLGTGTPPNYIPNAADLQALLNGLQDAKWLDNPDRRYPADCPPNCGDGYCDTDAGEDGANCPPDCS